MVKSIWDASGDAVSNHPIRVLLVIGILTMVFGAGLLVDNSVQDATGAFLPPKSELAVAQQIITDNFQTVEKETLQIIVRGDIYHPDTLNAMLGVGVVVDNFVQEFPNSTANAVTIGPAHVLAQALGVSDFDGLTRDEIFNKIVEFASSPTTAPIAKAVRQLVVNDPQGELPSPNAALMIVELQDEFGAAPEFPPGQITKLRLALDEVVKSYDWPAEVSGRTFSDSKLNDEVNSEQGSSMAFLMGGALLVILALLLLFYRNVSDVVFSLSGLILTIIWTLGAQGILVMLGLLSPGNSLGTMVPVLLIGLCVDYGLQFTAKYRELLVDGALSLNAVKRAAKHTGVPLFLAALTTVVSFLTNLGSNLPPIREFGIIAGIGVAFGWLIMTTWVPSLRAIFDSRRELQAKKLSKKLLTDAIPGANRLVGGLGRALTKHPVPILVIVGVLTAVAALGAANVSTTFESKDFLPTHTESYQDIVLVEEFGAGTSSATILIQGDLTHDATVRNLFSIWKTINDVNQRPTGITGNVTLSMVDVIYAAATAHEDYKELLATLSTGFDIAPETYAQIYDNLPAEFAPYWDRVVVENGTMDYTIMTFPTSGGSQGDTKKMVSELNSLWRGEPEAYTVTGGEVLLVTIVDDMTESQIQSVVLTILASLIVLMIVFGLLHRHAVLGVITVIPIAIVVVWVLGTMFAFGISYNILTALITALTLGVGVDYTIHITHRFIEELEESGDIREAIVETLGTTGGALLGSGLTTALGFGVLLFSPLETMQQFGGLTAVTIVFSLIGSFVVLPPMLILWALYNQWREGSDARNPRTEGFASMNCPRCGTISGIPHGIRMAHCVNADCAYQTRMKS